jgi:hypothetical protein
VKKLLNQFISLADDEKLAFIKKAMADTSKIFQNDPQKMMTGMMPVRMNMHKEVPDA